MSEGICRIESVFSSLRKDGLMIETKRLFLREMTQGDFLSLCKMLKNPRVMVAYEHAFSDEEVQDWLERQMKRYEDDGFGLWAVILKETNEMIGQCGCTMQQIEGERVVEIGYLFQEEFWHQGYATEAAIGVKRYGFDTLKVDELFSMIRDTNHASSRVAMRNGMKKRKSFVKHYYGMDMLHDVYSIKKEDE